MNEALKAQVHKSWVNELLVCSLKPWLCWPNVKVLVVINTNFIVLIRDLSVTYVRRYLREDQETVTHLQRKKNTY